VAAGSRRWRSPKDERFADRCTKNRSGKDQKWCPNRELRHHWHSANVGRKTIRSPLHKPRKIGPNVHVIFVFLKPKSGRIGEILAKRHRTVEVSII
jgi:hypothetical protein